MSIRSTFERAKHLKDPFSERSYSDLSLKYKKVSLEEFLSPADTDAKKRIVKREWMIDKAKYAYILSSDGKSIITTNQLRDLFNDIGLNVDITMSNSFGSDISAAQSIGGDIFPFSMFFARIFSKLFKRPLHVFMLQLGVSKSRFHTRFYHESDGSWIMVSHVDHTNIFNVFAVKKHFKNAASGDYKLGSELGGILLEKILEGVRAGNISPYDLNNDYQRLKG